MTNIFYQVDEGIEPHYDPITQDCRKIQKDGVDVWEITSYSIEERNDGSEFFQQFFSSAVSRKLKTIVDLQNDMEVWGKIGEESKDNLLAYKEQLESLDTTYPPGFSMPPSPDISSWRHTVPLEKILGL